MKLKIRSEQLGGGSSPFAGTNFPELLRLTNFNLESFFPSGYTQRKHSAATDFVSQMFFKNIG